MEQCSIAGQSDLENGGRRQPDLSASARSDGRSLANFNTGKPMCWYGAACRKIRDPAHSEKYDHETKPCKFGAKCRRKGRGCLYQHPAPGAQGAPLLNAAARKDRNNFSNRNEVNGNGLSMCEPEPERPIPFAVLLLCLCAVGLVGLPVIGECDESMHEKLFKFGCALGVPFFLFELLLLTCRGWVLRRFLEGDFSERATFRRLGCLWYPEPLQILRYTTGDQAGNNIEQYATWETNDLQQQVENVTGGNRDGGQVTFATGNFNMDFPGEFDSGAVTVDGDGTLQGLGIPAKFDGSNIVSGDGAWAKAGYWRLDWVTKILLLLFLIGIECSFVAVLMPPGVKGLGGLDGHERMPLNAVFVVDGSASITPDMWLAQQTAGEEFIQAFEKKYGRNRGELSMGLVQFSDDARTEQPLTSDIDAVLAKFQTLQQMEATTYFDSGLSLCKNNLESYASDRKSFDVCVLITDGVDMSELKPSALQALLPPDTAIFGIFVGVDEGGMDLLKSTVECGKAKSTKHECDFFASATDYKALSLKADEVADEVVRGVDVATCAEVSALIGIPTALFMCMPCILLYAGYTAITMVKRRQTNNNYRSLKNNVNGPSNTE